MEFAKSFLISVAFASLFSMFEFESTNPTYNLNEFERFDTTKAKIDTADKISLADGGFIGIGFQSKDTGSLRPKPSKKDHWDLEVNGTKRFILDDNNASSVGDKKEVEKIKLERKEKELSTKKAKDSIPRFILADGKHIGVGEKKNLEKGKQ